jgi:hypothetical protein
MDAAPIRPRWRRPLYAIPSAVALAAGVIVAVQFFERPVIGPDLSTPAEQQAFNLRGAARDACRSDQYRKCLDDLDQARALDPAGDATQRVKDLRAIAAEGIRNTPPPQSPAPPQPGPDDNLKVPRQPKGP